MMNQTNQERYIPPNVIRLARHISSLPDGDKIFAIFEHMGNHHKGELTPESPPGDVLKLVLQSAAELGGATQ